MDSAKVFTGTRGQIGLGSRFFLGFALASATAAGSAAHADGFPFSEEAQRAQWDRGCDDWPVDLEPLKVEIEKKNGDLRVLTRLVIKPEPGESTGELLKSVVNLLSDEKRYADWVMPGINDKAGGGRYFVTLLDMKSRLDAILNHHIITGDYDFKVLWFTRKGITSLLYRQEKAPLPKCAAFTAAAETQPEATRFIYRMIPREDLLKKLIAEIWVYRSGANVEARLRLVSTLPTLVYELMPESLLRRDVAPRGRRIFENFVDLRRTEADAAWASGESRSLSKAADRPKAER